MISPLAGEGDWAIDTMGHSSGDGFTMLKVKTALQQFVTNNISSEVVVGFRVIDADGSASGAFNPTQGSLLGTVTITLPNTVGATKHYVGDISTVNFIVPANKMVFCYIVSQTVTSANGLVVTSKIQEV